MINSKSFDNFTKNALYSLTFNNAVQRIDESEFIYYVKRKNNIFDKYFADCAFSFFSMRN